MEAEEMMMSKIVWKALKSAIVVIIVLLPAMIGMVGFAYGMAMFFASDTLVELTKAIILLGGSIVFGFFGTMFLGALAS